MEVVIAMTSAKMDWSVTSEVVPASAIWIRGMDASAELYARFTKRIKFPGAIAICSMTKVPTDANMDSFVVSLVNSPRTILDALTMSLFVIVEAMEIGTLAPIPTMMD